MPAVGRRAGAALPKAGATSLRCGMRRQRPRGGRRRRFGSIGIGPESPDPKRRRRVVGQRSGAALHKAGATSLRCGVRRQRPRGGRRRRFGSIGIGPESPDPKRRRRVAGQRAGAALHKAGATSLRCGVRRQRPHGGRRRRFGSIGIGPESPDPKRCRRVAGQRSGAALHKAGATSLRYGVRRQRPRGGRRRRFGSIGFGPESPDPKRRRRVAGQRSGAALHKAGATSLRCGVRRQRPRGGRRRRFGSIGIGPESPDPKRRRRVARQRSGAALHKAGATSLRCGVRRQRPHGGRRRRFGSIGIGPESPDPKRRRRVARQRSGAALQKAGATSLRCGVRRQRPGGGRRRCFGSIGIGPESPDPKRCRRVAGQRSGAALH